MGLHGRSPLLRLQSDERLITLLRRGNHAAFEVLVSRYHSRLLAFCRHLLSSKEDAEDVLQEVLAAAFNAILADERPINVRPWLYRIARNRSLNHLRRIQAIGVDSMDIHYSEHGASTADKVHERERFRLLVVDIHSLPETQRTALVLREMDAMSYEQIAEAMDTTVPGVKSLLVRARVSLAEAAEARQLSCDEVRIELGEVAEGLIKRPSPLVRRHLRGCRRCTSFQSQLKQTNKALAALLPIGPLALLRQVLLTHLGHSAGTSSGATAAGATGATAAGATGAAGAGAGGMAAAGTAGGGATFGSVGGLISAGAGAVATKAAAGLAAAALVTAGAVEASHVGSHPSHATPVTLISPAASGGAAPPALPLDHAREASTASLLRAHHKVHKAHAKATDKPAHAMTTLVTDTTLVKKTKRHKKLGRTDIQTDSTVLATPSQPASTPGSSSATDATATPAGSSAPSSSGTGTTGSTGPTGATGPTGPVTITPVLPSGDATSPPTPTNPGAAADPATSAPAPASGS